MFETMEVGQFVLAGIIIAVAYLVRGIAGFGSGLIAVPLLVMMQPLTIVVPLVVLLDYVASASHGLKHRESIQWRDILPLLPFTIIGVVLALYVFKSVDQAMLIKGLAIFIILFAFYNLLTISPAASPHRIWVVPAGSFGGMIGTLFGTGGPFYVIYLMLRGLDKTQFRASFATIFLMDGAARITGYASAGFFTIDLVLLVAVALPVMMVGMYIGGHIHTNLSQQTFKRAISVLLLISGAVLLGK